MYAQERPLGIERATLEPGVYAEYLKGLVRSATRCPFSHGEGDGGGRRAAISSVRHGVRRKAEEHGNVQGVLLKSTSLP